MPEYEVLKLIKLNGKLLEVGSPVTLDVRRGEWLKAQKAVKEIGVVAAAQPIAALVKPKPKAKRRCCGQ